MRDVLILVVGVVCGSAAPPLIAAIAAPGLVIAFWRNIMALVVLGPVALLRNRAELRRVPRRTLLLIAFAAAMLAVHFGGMASSLTYTSVASAAALVCTQAVWAAIFARIVGERLPGQAWFGIGVAFLGVVLLTGVDLNLSPRALWGDALAALAGLSGGAYMVSGGYVRQRTSMTAYTFLCYSLCAAILAAACLLARQPLTGYSARTWLLIAAVAVLAQLIGHSIFNLVMRSVSPSFVSLCQLFSMPLSAVLAAVALGQRPPLTAIPAFVLLLLGTSMVIRSQQRTRAGLAVDEL